MGILIELIVEVVLELVCHLIAEPFARFFEPALNTRSDKYSKPVALMVKTPLYFLFGGLIGYLSLFIHPEHLISNHALQWISLIVVPTCAGFAMSALGWWLERHSKRRTDFERFTYGFIFAFAYSLVRHIWVNP